MNLSAATSLVHEGRIEINARVFSDKQRTKLAKKGVALPDGSFPIASTSDLENAIKSVGRASDYATAKAHIIKRAKALKATKLLPPAWHVGKKKVSAGGPGSGRHAGSGGADDFLQMHNKLMRNGFKPIMKIGKTTGYKSDSGMSATLHPSGHWSVTSQPSKNHPSGKTRAGSSRSSFEDFMNRKS